MKKKVTLNKVITTEDVRELVIVVDVDVDCDDDEIRDFVNSDAQFDEPDWCDEWHIVDSSCDYGVAEGDLIEEGQDEEQDADLILRRDVNGGVVAVSA